MDVCALHRLEPKRQYPRIFGIATTWTWSAFCKSYIISTFFLVIFRYFEDVARMRNYVNNAKKTAVRPPACVSFFYCKLSHHHYHHHHSEQSFISHPIPLGNFFFLALTHTLALGRTGSNTPEHPHHSPVKSLPDMHKARCRFTRQHGNESLSGESKDVVQAEHVHQFW